VDADGKVTPITARTAMSASVSAPYLQITFTASGLAALRKGSLDKISYWLEGVEYAQTYPGGLAFAGIVFTDETPEAPRDPDTENPDDPGTEDPDDPGTEDPDDPGMEDPDDPGMEDPDDPGMEDPGDPPAEAPDKFSSSGGGGCDAGVFGGGLAGVAVLLSALLAAKKTKR
jgi:hypothetical protein